MTQHLPVLPVQVDDRVGSVQYADLLRDRGVPVELTRLDYGDIAFMGNGPEGSYLPVGVEIKQVGDAVGCILSGHFAEQLRGLRSAYSMCHLLVVGSPQKLQNLRIANRVWDVDTVQAWLFTMLFKGGIPSTWVWSEQGATEWLFTLYRWWCLGSWASHTSCDDWMTSEVSEGTNGGMSPIPLMRPTQAMLTAATLPGIGRTTAREVGGKFGTVEKMVLASEVEWRKVKGVGKKTAAKVWTAIRSVR